MTKKINNAALLLINSIKRCACQIVRIGSYSLTSFGGKYLNGSFSEAIILFGVLSA